MVARRSRISRFVLGTLAAATVALSAAACTPPVPDNSPVRPAGANVKAWHELNTGECYSRVGNVDDPLFAKSIDNNQIYWVQTVPCDQPHEAFVTRRRAFWNVEWFVKNCIGDAAEYLGRPVAETPFKVQGWAPTEYSLSKGIDTVICDLRHSGGVKSTGTPRQELGIDS